MEAFQLLKGHLCIPEDVSHILRIISELQSPVHVHSLGDICLMMNLDDLHVHHLEMYRWVI